MIPGNTVDANALSSGSRPRIVISATEFQRLSRLLEVQPDSPVLDYLSEELSRAQVVPDDQCDPDVVRMGSQVTYVDETTGETREVTLVWPHEAEIATRRVSVLTPIGAALIGLKPGQSIDWTTPGGDPRTLRVTGVRYEPDEAGSA